MKAVLVILMLSAAVYAGTYFAFDGRKTTIDGVTCVVVQARSGNGMGVSCDWGRK